MPVLEPRDVAGDHAHPVAKLGLRHLRGQPKSLQRALHLSSLWTNRTMRLTRAHVNGIMHHINAAMPQEAEMNVGYVVPCKTSICSAHDLVAVKGARSADEARARARSAMCALGMICVPPSL